MVLLVIIGFQNGEERGLGNDDVPNLFHPFLAFFLFLEQLLFSRDITAVALRGHILSER